MQDTGTLAEHLFSVVSGAPGRQFLVRSTAPAAVGNLCRADAARVAPTAPGRLLTGWNSRDIKRQLRRTAVLQSHTVETGAQEIAALVLASAVLATERLRAANGRVPVLRVSFGQLLNIVWELHVL
jgi:hypothetical protein